LFERCSILGLEEARVGNHAGDGCLLGFHMRASYRHS
jgi:hypothetical protein